MVRPTDQGTAFSGDFDDVLPLGGEGNEAFFGRDVLRGLIAGIDDFIEVRQPRWEQFRSLGPGLLGCAMWLDDQELLARLERLSGACVVISKQPRSAGKLAELAGVNERTPGLPTEAFPELALVAPRVDAAPAMIGPSDRLDDGAVPTIRTLGWRKRGGKLVPIVHAKLALLGSFWWHDEGPVGGEDVIGFTARRLWVSSANFTGSSRRSLDWGYWTEDRDLIEGAERFLLRLVCFSEALDPSSDSHEPELAPVEFDDAAIAEAWTETRAFAEGENWP